MRTTIHTLMYDGKNSKTALSFIKHVVLEVSTELEWQDWELSLPKNVGQSDSDCNGL